MKWTIANLLWLTAYLALLAAITAGLFALRHWSQVRFGTPQARTAWQQWKTETRRQAAGGGPVRRREAASSEPPSLVLMREYFLTVLTAALVLASVLFATFMFLARGALRTTQHPAAEEPDRPAPQLADRTGGKPIPP